MGTYSNVIDTAVFDRKFKAYSKCETKWPVDGGNFLQS